MNNINLTSTGSLATFGTGLVNLSICIATWNSEKFLPGLFESIFKQTIFTKEDYEIKVSINVVDSGSSDGSVEYIRKNYPEVHILRNTQNLGFSRSYNQAIRMCSSDYILVLNADVILDDDYIEKLLDIISKDDKIGSVCGKLLRVQFIPGNELCETEKTDTVDSFGLEIKRNRRFLDIGENEKDKGQYDKLNEVFGFSAAAVLYSRKPLDEIKYKEEYFDEDFFAYKEDIDLSWRLQIAGYKAIFVKDARAYHFRSSKSLFKKHNHLNAAKAYKQKNKMVRFHSYKNHLLLLIKNETTKDFFKDFFYITLYELQKFVYILLFDQNTLKCLKYVFKLIPKMREKRKKMEIRNRVDLKKWIR